MHNAIEFDESDNPCRYDLAVMKIDVFINTHQSLCLHQVEISGDEIQGQRRHCVIKYVNTS